MLTDWDRVKRNYQREHREDRLPLCPYWEVRYWRRRARAWRALFWLMLVALLLIVRK